MANPTLHVRIISPQQLLLDTQAKSVSSKNIQGDFDILPLHANFISVVENNNILIRDTHKKLYTYKFPIAIIYASNNEVNIFTYIQPNLEKKKP